MTQKSSEDESFTEFWKTMVVVFLMVAVLSLCLAGIEIGFNVENKYNKLCQENGYDVWLDGSLDKDEDILYVECCNLLPGPDDCTYWIKVEK